VGSVFLIFDCNFKRNVLLITLQFPLLTVEHGLHLLFVRLPDRLVVSYPNGDEVKNGDKKPAGSTVGEL